MLIYSAFGRIPLLGLNSAIETFISQAIGKEDRLQCLQILTRGLIVMCVVFPSVTVIFLLTDKILVSVKMVEPEDSKHTLEFIQIGVAYMFVFSVNDLFRRFLAS